MGGRPFGLRSTSDPALILPGGEIWSHADLISRVDATARHLDRPNKCLVALLADRQPGAVLAYLAALDAGHAVAWLRPDLPPSALSGLLHDFQPELVVAGPSVAPGVLETAGYRHRAVLPGEVVVHESKGDSVGADRIDSATALVLTTSGSTGGAKMVRLARGALEANAAAIVAALGITSRDRAVTSLPLHYTYGLSVLNSHLAAGACVALLDTSPTATRFWREFARLGCTTFAGVPLNFEFLATHRFDYTALAGIRAMTVAGGRLADQHVAEVAAALAQIGAGLYVMYGQTEATARMTVLEPTDLPARLGSAGRAVPGGRLSIEDAGGVALPDGTVGEVVYRGANVMQGYATSRADLALPDETGGVLRTRDLGYLDGGFLYLVGRIGRFIKPAGHRVGLDELERRLGGRQPLAAVPAAGERAVVFVESGPDPELVAGLHALTSEARLPPSTFVLRSVPALPRTGPGKVDYATLADWANEPTLRTSAPLTKSMPR